MEVYEDVDDRASFERVLAVATAAHDLASHADGGRHVECFCPMSGTVDV